MLLIYSHKESNRLRYTLKTIFRDILGIAFEITTDKDAFLKYQSAKLNYSPESFSKEIFFCCHDILFTTSIKSIDVKTVTYKENKALFPVSDERSYLPFDPFAAAFFMLSRYEEYLPHKKDMHHRFSAHESIAYKHGFLKKPVVNIWINLIKDILLQRYPDLVFKKRTFQFTPSYDIDIAFSYRSKGVVRTVGGYANDLIKRNFKALSARTKALLGVAEDPYDTYSFQINLHKRHNLNPIYFILLGEYTKYDKNISINNKRYQHLIKHLSDYGEVGIHPSYASFNQKEALSKEIKKLSSVLNKEVTASRQHYLRMNLPHTYRNLISMEIQHDYTMGFADETGFRAGICDPYYFYDLDMDSATKLRIHPFMYMEGTLMDYKHLNTAEALIEIKKLIAEVKAVEGTFISLWHNHSLSNIKENIVWRNLYEEVIEHIMAIKKMEGNA